MGITYEKIDDIIDVNSIKVEGSPSKKEILEVLDILCFMGAYGHSTEVVVGICKLFPKICYEKYDFGKLAEDMLKTHNEQGYLTPDQFWKLLDLKERIVERIQKKFRTEVEEAIYST